MRALCLPVLALLLLPSLAHSQTDWRSLLQRDLVTIQGDQMTLDRFTLDKIEFPGTQPVNVQVKYHGEAPIGTPDMEVNVIMTTGGIQFEIVNNSTGQRFRDTSTWANIFGEGR